MMQSQIKVCGCSLIWLEKLAYGLCICIGVSMGHSCTATPAMFTITSTQLEHCLRNGKPPPKIGWE